MAVICMNCGHEAKDEDKFCVNCGFKLPLFTLDNFEKTLCGRYKILALLEKKEDFVIYKAKDLVTDDTVVLNEFNVINMEVLQDSSIVDAFVNDKYLFTVHEMIASDEDSTERVD